MGHLKIDDISPEKLWLHLQLFFKQNGEACHDAHYLVWMKCSGHYLDWSNVHPESQCWRSSNHEHWCMENSFIATEPQKKEPIWILFSSVLWSAKVNKSFSHILYSPNRSSFYLVLQSMSFEWTPYRNKRDSVTLTPLFSLKLLYLLLWRVVLWQPQMTQIIFLVVQHVYLIGLSI